MNLIIDNVILELCIVCLLLNGISTLFRLAAQRFSAKNTVVQIKHSTMLIAKRFIDTGDITKLLDLYFYTITTSYCML